nr:hypothetical protein [Sulfolobus sp. E11-6]
MIDLGKILFIFLWKKYLMAEKEVGIARLTLRWITAMLSALWREFT